MTRPRDYRAEYQRRDPEKLREYRRLHPATPERLAHMRAYYQAHKADLDAASIERVKAWRARKRQGGFIARWSERSGRFEYRECGNDRNASD